MLKRLLNLRQHVANEAEKRQLLYQISKAAYLKQNPDLLAGITSARRAHAQGVQRTVEQFRPIQPGDRIIEVGSGSHGIVFFLDHPHLLGVDPLARQYAQLFPFWQKDTRTVSAYGEELPFAEASFEVVLSDNVVDHAKDPAAIVREMYRVLTPGGLMYFTVNVHHRFYSLMSAVARLVSLFGVDIGPFGDHTVHLTPDDARRLFVGLNLNIVHHHCDVAAPLKAARSVPPRHWSDYLKRVFFKNAHFELVALKP